MKKITPILISPFIVAIAGSVYIDTETVPFDEDYASLPELPKFTPKVDKDAWERLSEVNPMAVLCEKLQSVNFIR